MEKRFKSLTIFEFQQMFPDDISCLKYLSDKKWAYFFGNHTAVVYEFLKAAPMFIMIFSIMTKACDFSVIRLLAPCFGFLVLIYQSNINQKLKN